MKAGALRNISIAFAITRARRYTFYLNFFPKVHVRILTS